MLQYVCNKTAAPFFSNLVWFIGNHVIELDECLLSQAQYVCLRIVYVSLTPPSLSVPPPPPPPPLCASHLNRGRLEGLVAEHLDHLYYIKDILSLGVVSLNSVLIDQLLNRLLIPLYVFSLTDQSPSPEGVSVYSYYLPGHWVNCSWSIQQQENPRISGTVALFLLAQVCPNLHHSYTFAVCACLTSVQVFLIISEPDVVLPLAYVILTGDTSVSLPSLLTDSSSQVSLCQCVADDSIVFLFQCQRRENTIPQFAPPVVKLDQETSLRQPVYVPARAQRSRGHWMGRRRQGEDGEGSSTESQADLHDMNYMYVDHVVDAQYPEYVVIEASPGETGKEVSYDNLPN